MSVRELLHLSKNNVPVTHGGNPIVTFQDEMNKLFSDFFGDMTMPQWLRNNRNIAFNLSPAIDVAENNEGFIITAELPGMDIKDVQITMANGYLTVKGEKKQEEKEEKEGYFRQERSYGTFQRVVALPENANLDKAEANLKNGVLTIDIPKKANVPSKERKLEIRQVA